MAEMVEFQLASVWEGIAEFVEVLLPNLELQKIGGLVEVNNALCKRRIKIQGIC